MSAVHGRGIRIMATGTTTAVCFPTWPVACLLSIERPEKTAACRFCEVRIAWAGLITSNVVTRPGPIWNVSMSPCNAWNWCHVEMAPGSAVLFHGNTLHRSDQNVSENPRWAFICCYNTRSNNPYKEGRHPHYSRSFALMSVRSHRLVAGIWRVWRVWKLQGRVSTQRDCGPAGASNKQPGQVRLMICWPRLTMGPPATITLQRTTRHHEF